MWLGERDSCHVKEDLGSQEGSGWDWTGRGLSVATWAVEDGDLVLLVSCTHTWGQAAAGGGAGGEQVTWAPGPGLGDRRGTLG